MDAPAPSPHTYSTAFSGPFQWNGDQGPEAPPDCRHGTQELCEGQRQGPHTIVNLWHRSPGVSLQGRLDAFHCPLPTPVTRQTHLLAATSLNPSSLVMLNTWPGRATLGPSGIPFGVWKHCSGTGVSARFGQAPGQGKGDSHQHSLLTRERHTPLWPQAWT